MSDGESRRSVSPRALTATLQRQLIGGLRRSSGSTAETDEPIRSGQRVRLPQLEFQSQVRGAAVHARSLTAPALTTQGDGLARDRDEIDVPIASSREVGDEELFEDPTDDALSWYLPRYAIGEDGNRLEVYLRSFDDRAGGTLTLDLVSAPAPAIAEQVAASSARPLEHEVEIVIRYSRLEGIQEEVAFASEELTETDDGRIRAVLTVTTAQRFSSLYQALSDTSMGTRIVVQRTARVAVPVEVERGRAERDRADEEARPAPERATERAQERAHARERAERERAERDRERELERRRQQQERAKVRDHRTGRTGQSRSGTVGRVVRDHRGAQPVATPRPQRDRAAVPAQRRAAEHTSRPSRSSRSSPSSRPSREHTTVPSRRGQSAEPRRDRELASDGGGHEVSYRATVVTLDQVLEPSTFSPDQQPHVFRDAVDRPSAPGGFQRRTVRSGGREHDYYQDLSEPNRFFYLPDEFRLARRSASPFTPDMVVRFDRDEGDGDATVAEVEYVGVPWIDHDRLQDAAEHLQEEHGRNFPEGRGVELTPLRSTRQPALLLRLPGAGPEYREQEGAVVELDSGVRGGFRVPLATFERVFSAMLGDGSGTGGQVRLEVGHGEAAYRHHIPFPWSFRELAGEVFVFDEAPGQRNGISVVNAIESPVRIERPDALVVRADGVVPAALSGVELPLELLPGESVDVELEAVDGEPLDDVEAVALPPGAFVVVPDDQEILDAVVDSAIGIDDERTIEVSMFRQTLTSPVPGVPGSSVLAVIVEFEGGSTEVFDADACEGVRCTVQARVRASLADAILRRPESGRYRYRITVHFTVDGEDTGTAVQALESDELEHDGDVLIIDLEHVRPQGP